MDAWGWGVGKLEYKATENWFSVKRDRARQIKKGACRYFIDQFYCYLACQLFFLLFSKIRDWYFHEKWNQLRMLEEKRRNETWTSDWTWNTKTLVMRLVVLFLHFSFLVKNVVFCSVKKYFSYPKSAFGCASKSSVLYRWLKGSPLMFIYTF